MAGFWDRAGYHAVLTFCIRLLSVRVRSIGAFLLMAFSFSFRFIGSSFLLSSTGVLARDFEHSRLCIVIFSVAPPFGRFGIREGLRGGICLLISFLSLRYVFPLQRRICVLFRIITITYFMPSSFKLFFYVFPCLFPSL